MALVNISVEVDEGSPDYDPDHEMGISQRAWERLTEYSDEHGAPALMWLGEVQEVERVDA